MDEGHASSPSWASKHNYTQVASRQAVIDSAGQTYWQDHDNDIVWVKLSIHNTELGDLVQFHLPQGAYDTPLSRFYLYNEFHLRIW